jgi:hypothetical protein
MGGLTMVIRVRLDTGSYSRRSGAKDDTRDDIDRLDDSGVEVNP